MIRKGNKKDISFILAFDFSTVALYSEYVDIDIKKITKPNKTIKAKGGADIDSRVWSLQLTPLLSPMNQPIMIYQYNS